MYVHILPNRYKYVFEFIILSPKCRVILTHFWDFFAQFKHRILLNWQFYDCSNHDRSDSRCRDAVPLHKKFLFWDKKSIRELFSFTTSCPKSKNCLYWNTNILAFWFNKIGAQGAKIFHFQKFTFFIENQQKSIF